jgi:hypothetical protein
VRYGLAPCRTRRFSGNGALTLVSKSQQGRVRAPIPVGVKLPDTMWAPPVATGRGSIRPPRAGGRRLEGRSYGRPDLQEDRANRQRQGASNGGGASARQRTVGAIANAPAMEQVAGSRRGARNRNRRERGRWQGVPGTPKVPRKPQGASKEAVARPPGAGGQPALGLPDWRPRTRRTLRELSREAIACAQSTTGRQNHRATHNTRPRRKARRQREVPFGCAGSMRASIVCTSV